MMLHAISLDIRSAAAARRSVKLEPWQLTYARDIGPEDLVLLQSSLNQVPSDPRAPLARIREPHHMMAQLLAQGKPLVDVARITGFSPSRIYTLRHDPAFKELIAHYEEAEAANNLDIQGQLKNIALTAGQIIQERLLDDPESFTTKDLRELLVNGMDRTGFGPTSKVDMTLNSAPVVEAIMQQVAQETRGQILSRTAIETEYTEVTEVVEVVETEGVHDGSDETSTGA